MIPFNKVIISQKPRLFLKITLGDPYECYSYDKGKLVAKLINWDKHYLYPEKVQAWTLGAMYSFSKNLI